MDNIFSSFGSIVTPGAALGTLGLGLDAALGQQQPKGYGQVLGQANALGQQGQQLIQAGMGGPLPPGANALLNQQQNAATAAERASMARMGLSGSTMEAQDLQSIVQQRSAEAWKIAQGFMSDGMRMTGMSADMYKSLMQLNVAEDTAFMQSVGKFAAALAGGASGGKTDG